jgi:hypothetical protein
MANIDDGYAYNNLIKVVYDEKAATKKKQNLTCKK